MSSSTSLNGMAVNVVSPSTSKTVKTSPSKKKSTSLPAETVDYLKAWMMSPEHIAHPYPTEQEKAQIMADTGIELKQLTNWFVNNRKRYWKPRVEARLQQQVQLPSASPSSPIKRRSSGGSKQLGTIDLVDQTLVRTPATTAPPVLGRKASTESLKSLKATTSRDSSPAPFLRRVVSQAVVSDASSSSASCASDTASVFSAANDEDMVTSDSSSGAQEEIADGTVARTETVDVHILRPLNGIKPTIADVSILSTVPHERILYTYESRSLTYRFAADAIQDRKKVQSRRDGEIVRLKRRFLKLFLEQAGNTQVAKRSYQETSEVVDMSPRKKFRRESVKIWKEACKAAEDLYDTDLPTLEEATLLFGFSRGLSA